MKALLTLIVACGLGLNYGCEKKPSGSSGSSHAPTPSAANPGRTQPSPRPLTSDQMRLIALGKVLMELDYQTQGQYAQLMSELDQTSPDAAPTRSVSDSK